MGNSSSKDKEPETVTVMQPTYCCFMCPDQFATAKQLLAHANQKHPPTCQMCGAKFPTIDALHLHFKNHERVKCQICNVDFENGVFTAHYNAHMCKTHQQVRERCELCKYPRPASVDPAKVHVAVIGRTNAGKSSAFNRLTGASHPEKAVEDPVQTPPETMSLGAYSCQMWDIPGYSGTNDPKDYVRRYGLRYMHVVVVVLTESVSPEDRALLECIREFGGKASLVLVANKIDMVFDWEQSMAANLVTVEARKRDLLNMLGMGDALPMVAMCSVKNPKMVPSRAASDELCVQFGVFVLQQREQLKHTVATLLLRFNPNPPTCFHCTDKQPTHAYMPCGHKVLCGGCAKLYTARAEKQCAICRREFAAINKVFD